MNVIISNTVNLIGASSTYFFFFTTLNFPSQKVLLTELMFLNKWYNIKNKIKWFNRLSDQTDKVELNIEIASVDQANRHGIMSLQFHFNTSENKLKAFFLRL